MAAPNVTTRVTISNGGGSANGNGTYSSAPADDTALVSSLDFKNNASVRGIAQLTNFCGLSIFFVSQIFQTLFYHRYHVPDKYDFTHAPRTVDGVLRDGVDPLLIGFGITGAGLLIFSFALNWLGRRTNAMQKFGWFVLLLAAMGFFIANWMDFRSICPACQGGTYSQSWQENATFTRVTAISLLGLGVVFSMHVTGRGSFFKDTFTWMWK